MARPPNSWVWQHFRHLSQGDNYSNVECVMCNKAFRYSSRNGPTNLARHINKNHGLNQPSTITRRPFPASGPRSNENNNGNGNETNGSNKRQKNNNNGSNVNNSNSNNNNNNNNNNTNPSNSNGTTSNDDSIVVGNNQEPNSFSHVDSNGTRLNGVVTTNVLDLGNDSFGSSQLLGNSPSSNGLVLSNKYPVHDYSDPISRRVATSTPTFRLEQLPHRSGGNGNRQLSISQQQSSQSQTQQQPQTQQTQAQQTQAQQAQSQTQQVQQSQQTQQTPQQRSTNSLDSQVVGNQNPLNSNPLYDHPELYTTTGSQNQNYSVIIQSIIHTQSQIQLSLRNLERSNIRLEQKFARTTNLTRGSGLDDKYELVPFATGLDPKAVEPRLPLLYDIFTLFNCSNQVLDVYLNNYEIANPYPPRQEKIFKLANFIGCNDIEKYWNDYTGIFRTSNVVGLDGSKMD